MTETKTISVDFDGVIHDYKNPVEGRRMGAPIAGTIEALTELQNNGYKIVVYTVRATETGKQHIQEWLDFYHIPYNDITNVKPNADFYIDDKAIRFTAWPEALKEIIQ